MSDVTTETMPPAGGMGRENAETGMLLMTGAMLLVPTMDVFAKLLSDTQSAAQVAFCRFLFQTTVLAIILLMARQLRWPRGHLRHLVGAGGLIGAAIVLFFWAIKYLPIANAISIFFVEPLILTIFSAVFLGEKVGWRRVLAVLVGLVGAMVVIRPNWSAYGWPAVLPLGTAFCFAGYLIIIRHMSSSLSGVQTQAWIGFFAMLALGGVLLVGTVWPAEPLVFHPAGVHELTLLLGLGLVATIGHFVIAQAFRYAPASVLAPFQYLEIIGATILGYLVFDDFPDAMTWLGTGIILAAGLYVFNRERRLHGGG